MGIFIREASMKDAEALIELRRQLDDVHAAARPDLFASADLYDTDSIRSYIEAEKSQVIVAEDGASGRVIAYMILNTEKSPQSPIFTYPRTFVYMNDLCVREECRGQGIGKSLMEYAIAYAKNKNADGLELNVAEFNTNAIKLYESMGLKSRNRRMELLLK